jgi:hypothetical protein
MRNPTAGDVCSIARRRSVIYGFANLDPGSFTGRSVFGRAADRHAVRSPKYQISGLALAAVFS